ncbi:MAG: HAD family hydrolase [Anaerolineales bacterium]
MLIRAVIFDLGNTLMYPVASDLWPEVIKRGNQALIEYLCNLDILTDCDDFLLEFNQRLHQYYDERDEQMIETSTFLVLKELLAEKGHSDVSDTVIRDSLDAHYAVTQKNWQLEEDTITCLSTLQERNYKLGLLSNAGDHRDVIQLVEKFGLESYFEFILTSAGCGYRKPHQKIFQLALEKANAKAEEVAMVGDTLNADILGANQIGMYSIWITRRVDVPPDGELPVQPQPQATINSLGELPSLLRELELDLHS